MIKPIKQKTEMPDFRFEAEAIETYGPLICGVDEAGRGPWAGPVVAAAVILNPLSLPDGLNDSKKLTEQQREDLFDQLMDVAMVGVAMADVARIDTDNILNASLWAMAQSISKLPQVPKFALIDGNKSPQLPMPSKTIVKGDGRSLSIAAASIIAKVTRDRLMVELDFVFPEYGWARNKGYGTKAHQEGLKKAGVTPHHRRSFKPIKQLLGL